MKNWKSSLTILLIIAIAVFSCKDDDEGNDEPVQGTTVPQDTTTVSADGFTVISKDAVGDATFFDPADNTLKTGGLDGTKLEYKYDKLADEITFRMTTVDLSTFSRSPSFDLSFQLPNGTVPAKPLGSPFRGNTMTHRTFSVYTDDNGNPPSSYSFNNTADFAINGGGFTGGFIPRNDVKRDSLKNICEGCVDFQLDVTNNWILATIDRNLIIKNEEFDATEIATIKMVANVGFSRRNNDLIADGEEFTIKLFSDTSNTDTLNPDLAQVRINSFTNLSQLSVTANAEVISVGISDVSLRGVCYSVNPNPTLNDNVEVAGNGIGNFSKQLSNLSVNTTYYVRAFANNTAGTSYSEERSFTTLKNDAVPSLTTSAATQITNTTATFNGSLIDNGNLTVTERGFVASLSPNPDINDFKDVSNGNGLGSYSINVNGLPPNTKFYVRAYAINSLGVGYGNEVNFTTANNMSLATINTVPISNLTKTSARSGIDIQSTGNSTITEAGIVYSTSPNPNLLDNLLKVNSINGAGQYSLDISGLSQNTTYYVKSFAENSVGITYGNEILFTTATDPIVNTVSVGTITSSTAVFNGDFISTGRLQIIEKGFCYGTSFNPTINNGRVSASNVSTGSYQLTATNLFANVEYNMRAYVISSTGVVAYGSNVEFNTFLIGNDYQGGKIAYLDNTGIHGFVVSNSDISSGQPWKPNSDPSQLTGANRSAIGEAAFNNMQIASVHGVVSNYAAATCFNYNNGFSNWLLPTIDELAEIYSNRSILGPFTTGAYWSSTETSASEARFFVLVNGLSLPATKPNAGNIRAIRYF